MRSPFGLLVLISGLALIFASCAQPAPKTESKAESEAPCTGREPSCKKLAAHLEILSEPKVKLTAKERKVHGRSIYGHCEILVEDGSPEKSYPCTDLRVTVIKDSGEERMTWLQGFDFEVPELSKGVYVMNVYSDQFETGAEKAKIQPGHPVKIQLKLSPLAQSK